MNHVASMVGHVAGRCKGEDEEQNAWKKVPASSAEIRQSIKDHEARIFAFLEEPQDSREFDRVERGLVPLVFALGRLYLAYYLARRHEASKPEVRRWLKKGLRKSENPQPKFVSTFFGRVCFWRTYVRRGRRSGLHPLDVALGLPADGFSLWMCDLVGRLSTLVPFDQVTGLCLYFMGWSPSKTSVEKAVLGLGVYTEEWFAAAPPPAGDGEVLVIQVDSKAFPTATEEELSKRRGKRPERERPISPRHRGRAKRKRAKPNKRKAPGDKSKNGKAATIVVMYTLKIGKDHDGKPALLGPINKRHYASCASKRHAFEVARREADKRGFAMGSGKLIQIVTDGDEDLERYSRQLFPDARHTLDIAHVLEYLWEAGRLAFKEGSPDLIAWVKRQEALLYRGKEVQVAQHVCDLKKLRPSARERLGEIYRYLAKRVRLMDYQDLRRQDLEIGSGAVEGAVRHVIAKRFDYGSMRWIKERAEPLLQLRCIEVSGTWTEFIRFVEARLRDKTTAQEQPARLLRTKPGPLPAISIAA